METEERRHKGTYLLSTLSYIEKKYDAEAREQITASLSPDTRLLLSRVDKNTWYPIRHGIELLRAIDAQHEDKQEVLAGLRRCGQLMGEEASTTFLKLLTKILTPALFLSKFPDFWLRYHNFGPCRVDASEVKQNRATVFVPGYDYVHHVGAGWIVHVFTSLGKKNIEVDSNVPLDQITTPEVRWDFRWTS